jgi:hypothetical protein
MTSGAFKDRSSLKSTKPRSDQSSRAAGAFEKTRVIGNGDRQCLKAPDKALRKQLEGRGRLYYALEAKCKAESVNPMNPEKTVNPEKTKKR